ncbi:LIC11469 family lipoprotein adhesin Lsa20 [Leptospira sp. 'Mane']|uniref:LIC11469 family lipoprotein adhesin Lsa20 n=1 Tax=Leptospira sp. 'Mane' TaxID=3387407 RepID=UPI00398A9E3C
MNLSYLFRFFFFSIFISLFGFCGEGDKNSHNHSQVEDSPSSPTKSSSVEIEIGWLYTQLPLKMEIREPSGSQSLALWTTGSVPFGKSAPFSTIIVDSKILLKPGAKKQFLLVMKNDTDSTVYFFAAPHQAHPVEHSFGFKFKCLCVNHAFTVPPGEFWYRVVEIRLSPEFLGDKLTLTHNVIGITKERMLDFEKGSAKSFTTEMD